MGAEQAVDGGGVYLRHEAACVAALTVAALFVRIAAAPFGAPLLLDSFAYLRKAVELSQGNIVPIESHAIGWSLMLMPFVAAFRSAAPMTQMDVARLAGCLVGALVVVPTAVVAREVLPPSARAWPVVAVAFAEPLVRVSTSAFAEPAITLVLTGVVAALLAARRRHEALAVGAALAGFAMWLHPTAIVVPFIGAAVLASMFGLRASLQLSARLFAVALVLAAPVATQRLLAFGSPLAYGQNNRFFVDSENDLWAADAASPGIVEYLRTHSAAQVLDRLVIRGAWRELGHFAVSVVHLPVVPFLIVGCAIAVRESSLRAVVVAMALFLAAWLPAYDLFGTGRHLVPALPFALVLAAAGLARATASLPRAAAWSVAAIIAFVCSETIVAQIARRDALSDPRIDGIAAGRWIAEHARGRLAMVEGHELVMMHLSDAVVGGNDINAISAPITGLQLVRPGSLRTLEAAIDWLRARRMTYVAAAPGDPSTWWAERLATPSSGPAVLVERYASAPQSRWPIRVYEVRENGLTLKQGVVPDPISFDQIRPVIDEIGEPGDVEASGPAAGRRLPELRKRDVALADVRRTRIDDERIAVAVETPSARPDRERGSRRTARRREDVRAKRSGRPAITDERQDRRQHVDVARRLDDPAGRADEIRRTIDDGGRPDVVVARQA